MRAQIYELHPGFSGEHRRLAEERGFSLEPDEDPNEIFRATANIPELGLDHHIHLAGDDYIVKRITHVLEDPSESKRLTGPFGSVKVHVKYNGKAFLAERT